MGRKSPEKVCKTVQLDLLVELGKKYHVFSERNSTKLNQIWKQIAIEFNQETGLGFDGKKLSKMYSNRKSWLRKKRSEQKVDEKKTGGGPSETNPLSIHELKQLCDMGEENLSFETRWDTDAVLAQPLRTSRSPEKCKKQPAFTNPSSSKSLNEEECNAALNNIDFDDENEGQRIVAESDTSITVNRGKQRVCEQKQDIVRTVQDISSVAEFIEGPDISSPHRQNDEGTEEQAVDEQSKQRKYSKSKRVRLQPAAESIREYLEVRSMREEVRSNESHDLHMATMEALFKEAQHKEELARKKLEMEEELHTLRMDHERKMMAIQLSVAKAKAEQEIEAIHRGDQGLQRCRSSSASIRRLNSILEQGSQNEANAGASNSLETNNEASLRSDVF